MTRSVGGALLAALAAAVFVGACASSGSHVVIPTASNLPAGADCGSAHLDNVSLAGDPKATPAVWVEAAGVRYDVLWPPGSYADFGATGIGPSPPDISVFSGDELLARAGERLDIVGRSAQPDLFVVCKITVEPKPTP